MDALPDGEDVRISEKFMKADYGMGHMTSITEDSMEDLLERMSTKCDTNYATLDRKHSLKLNRKKKYPLDTSFSEENETDNNDQN